MNRATAAALFVLVIALTGCAAGIKPEVSNAPYAYDGRKFDRVTVQMSPQAKKELPDNLDFDAKTFEAELTKVMDAGQLLQSGSDSRVLVTVKDIRSRSTLNAVLWGFMAGDDHVVGDVTLLGAGDRPLHKFEVSASYALGGLAGGTDTRMGWLYRRFAELTMQELKGAKAQ